MPEVADLLLMQQRLRQYQNRSQLWHFIVNDSNRIVGYQSAVLVVAEHVNSLELAGVSGLPEPLENIPFTDWVKKLTRFLHDQSHKNALRLESAELDETLLERQAEFFPAHVVWVPLLTGGRNVGGLLFGKTDPWLEEELRILDYWGGAVAHAVYARLFARETSGFHWRQLATRRVALISIGLVFLLMLMPVSLTVNSSAEVVPSDPVIVRAPIDGIIGDVRVRPNQRVSTSELILTFEDTSIKAEIDVVDQELAISMAELQRAQQASVSDRKASSELPMLEARVEQNRSKVAYTRSLLERSRLYASQDGIVVIPVESELEGKPVQIGEKLFTLATPGEIELEFWLAVGDSIPLPQNAEAELFLNVYPDESHPVTVDFITYQAEVSPDGILGFRGRANFDGDPDLRIGWRGTAKLYGERVTLFYFLFRKPLSVLRQWLGI